MNGTSGNGKPKGFAALSADRVREIASKGGRAAQDKGTARKWTPDEAREAGRKGGLNSRGGRGKILNGQE